MMPPDGQIDMPWAGQNILARLRHGVPVRIGF
jgi:hypothetical protein